jgi:hypothetical protein
MVVAGAELTLCPQDEQNACPSSMFFPQLEQKGI